MGVLVQGTSSPGRAVAILVAILMLVALTPVVPVQAIGTTWYVDVATGDDGNPGTMAEPFMSITAGLAAAASGDTVMVAPGTYSAGVMAEPVPLETSGEVFPLEVPGGVMLVSSGGSEVTIIDGEHMGYEFLTPSENGRTAPIIWIMGATGVTVEGFSVVNGYSEEGAGALVVESTEVIFRDVVFDENFAFAGAGMLVANSSITLEECAFTGTPMGFNREPIMDVESAMWPYNAVLGGGLLAGASQVALHECDFYGNTAAYAGGSAIFIESSVSVSGGSVAMGFITGGEGPVNGIRTLEEMTALEPSAISWMDTGELEAQEIYEDAIGGGFAVLGSVVSVDGTPFTGNGAPNGGAIFVDEYSDLSVAGATFEENYAIWGSGVSRGMSYMIGRLEGMDELGFSALENGPMLEPALYVEKSIFGWNWLAETVVSVRNESGSPSEFVNCLFHDNTVYASVLWAQDTDVTNCTFADNMLGDYLMPGDGSAQQLNGYYGATVSVDASSSITNGILWGNGWGYDMVPLDVEAAIAGPVDIYGGHVAYTNAEGIVDAYEYGDGNISEDPRFLDGERDDYRLRPGSPSIDTGTDEGAPADDLLDQMRPYDGDFDGTAVTDMGAYEYMPVGTIRTGGIDRYDTAVKISRENFDSSEVVIIARGDDFADGLASSGLAGIHKAPVLLTKPGSLPLAVAEEIERLGAEYAIIVGGPVAVNPVVKTALEALNLEVDRIGGADRYATSILIADEIAALVGDPDMVFGVRGDRFPDALTVSPVAYGMQVPIILLRAGTFPEAGVLVETLDRAEKVVIVGGEDGVSQETEGSVAALATVERIAGEDRYETAVLFSEHAVDEGWAEYAFVGVATGRDFPDALAGGAAVGSWNGVIVLTRRDTLYVGAEQLLSDNKTQIFRAEIFGGTAAVSDAVKTAVEAAIAP